ncbi:MAG: hypothetical protein LBC55_04445 [Desulfovibrio sp.]|jgi:hypothetical protein|nr:hypothetical protein [Desulfovibrio sp.]
MPNDDEMSTDFKVDESGDADDDIIDLLEVVKPGRPLSAAEQDDADFTDDLESMLDDLSREENVSAQSALRKFPDPTPVDYSVDHNERLDLPDMDDLDNILQSLDADDQRAARRENGIVEPRPDLKEPPLPDLDAVPMAGDDEDILPIPPTGGGFEDDDTFPLHSDALAEKTDEEAIELDMDGLGELLDAVPLPPPADAARGPAGDRKPAAPVPDTASLRESTPEAVPAAQATAPEPPPDLFEVTGPGETAPAPQQDTPPPAAPPKAQAALKATPPAQATPVPPAAPSAQATAPEPPPDLFEVTGPEETVPAPHQDTPPPAAAEAPQATPAAPAPLAGAAAPEDALEAGEGESDLPPDVLDALSDVYPDYADDAAGAHSAASLDDVNLVELDALLDDMLSNAPASGPRPAPGDAAPRFAESSLFAGLGESATSGSEGNAAGGDPADASGKAGSPQSSPGSGESSDASAAGQTEGSRTGGSSIGFEEAANLAAIPGLISELNSLRGDLETLRAEAGSARTQTGDTERIGKRLDSFSAGLASLASRLEDLELAHMAGANKETAREHSAAAAASKLVALEEQAGRAETALAALNEQARQAEAELNALKGQTGRAEAELNALKEQTGRAEAGLASLEERAQRLEDAHARLDADLEKMAAAAAARVIREELAALVAGQHRQ